MCPSLATSRGQDTLGAQGPAAYVDPPVQLEERVDGGRAVLRRQGGGAQLAFHVWAGSYDTGSLIEVLGDICAESTGHFLRRRHRL